MQFASSYFIIFFIASICGYYIFPAKYRYVFILICDILFLSTWIQNNNYSDYLIILAVILITYFFSIILGKHKSKALVIFGAIITLSFLLYFKYWVFTLKNLNLLLNHFGTSVSFNQSIISPIGISFFTFQALGYMIDVYRGKSEPEKNIFRYMSYVIFFPTITSGPIERSTGLLAQLRDSINSRFEYKNLQTGFILAVWGAFIKLVISDRLSVIANTVFDNYKTYGGFILVFASICYTLQIYCDFSSYSLMALGVSRMLGINVIENFKAPYLAESVQEFWRRWHISLSTWFRDYVYISLGGNRCSAFRKQINLLVTFLVSGIWHGANWTFIFWGLLHGFYQVIGNLTKKIRGSFTEKLKINTECFSFHLWRKLFVFSLISLAWIFFRSPSIGDSFEYIIRIFERPMLWNIFDNSIYNLGLSVFQMNILFISLLILFAADIKKYKTDSNIDSILLRQNMLFRCLFIAGIILFTVVFGMYGPDFNAQDFIYFHF